MGQREEGPVPAPLLPSACSVHQSGEKDGLIFGPQSIFWCCHGSQAARSLGIGPPSSSQGGHSHRKEAFVSGPKVGSADLSPVSTEGSRTLALGRLLSLLVSAMHTPVPGPTLREAVL